MLRSPCIDVPCVVRATLTVGGERLGVARARWRRPSGRRVLRWPAAAPPPERGALLVVRLAKREHGGPPERGGYSVALS